MNRKANGCCKTKRGRLFRKFSYRAFILDDESPYLTLTHPILNNNGGYYISDVSSTRPIIKFSTKIKFENKIDWIAMILKARVIRWTKILDSLSIGSVIGTSAFAFVSSHTSIKITTAVITSSGQI